VTGCCCANAGFVETLIEVWQAGLQQVKASSSVNAAAWLGSSYATAALLTTALMTGVPSKELSIAEVSHMMQQLLSDCQPARHMPREQAQQLVTCIVEPAIQAAAALDSSCVADPVPLLAYMWQTWVLVASLGHLQVAAALLPSLLQLQLQLALGLALNSSKDVDGGPWGDSARLMWGIVVGSACDSAQLEATLALLAKHRDTTCSAAVVASVFVAGASEGTLSDNMAEISSLYAAACERAVAAQSVDISVSRKASFTADILRAAQQWRSADGIAVELPDSLLELSVSFHKLHRSELDPQELLPDEIGLQLLERLLVACHDSQAGEFVQHLLQQAPEEQLQQLPTSVLIRAASTVLRFARLEAASDGSAAAVVLKALAAAAHSAAGSDNSSWYAQGQAGVLLTGVKVETKVNAIPFLPSKSQCYFKELGVLCR
jgi:hypothetical protein